MKPAPDNWPPAKVAPLKRLYAEGRSFAQIAKRMDISRNAVSGKLDRLGLFSTEHPDVLPGARQAPSRPRRFSWEAGQ